MACGRPLGVEDLAKLSEQIGDLRLQYLQRTYDRRSIAERYLTGQCRLHVHCIFGQPSHYGAPVSTAKLIHESEVNLCLRVQWHRDSRAYAECQLFAGRYFDEFPMFVLVGQAGKRLYPFASVAPLQLLNACDISLLSSLSLDNPIPLEIIWAIIDRKLTMLLDAFRVTPRETINQVVQTRTEIMDNFTDQHADHHNRGIRKHWPSIISGRNFNSHQIKDLRLSIIDDLIDVPFVCMLNSPFVIVRECCPDG